MKDVDSFIFCIKYTTCVRYLCVVLDSVPEFQGIKRLIPEEKIEDCQSYNNSEEVSNEKDKVNNKIKIPEQETVLQENMSGLSYGTKIDSESATSSLIESEEQPQGDPYYLIASKIRHTFLPTSKVCNFFVIKSAFTKYRSSLACLS